MTSTTQRDLTGRNSSRVLRPPGGGGSNIFGFADDEPKPVKKIDQVAVPPSEATQNTTNATINDKTTDTKEEEENKEICAAKQPTDDVTRQTIAQKHRVGAAGFNPITGQPLNETQVHQFATEADGSTMKSSCLDSECLSMTLYKSSNERLKLSSSLFEYETAADVDLTCYETFYDDDNIDKEFLKTNIIESASWLSDVSEVEVCANETSDTSYDRWFVVERQQDVSVTDGWRFVSTGHVEESGIGLSDLFQVYDLTNCASCCASCSYDVGSGPSESGSTDSAQLFELAISQQVPELFSEVLSSTSGELVNDLNESDEATEMVLLPSIDSIDSTASTAVVVVSDTKRNVTEENAGDEYNCIATRAVAGSSQWYDTDQEENVTPVGLSVLSTRLFDLSSVNEDSSSDCDSSDRRVPQSCVTMEHVTYGHFIEE